MTESASRHTALRRVQGLVFILVIALLIGLAIAVYDRKLPWQASDHVTVKAASIGNQLTVPADVKYDGVLVGRVSSVHSNGALATLNLQIDKSQLSHIPADVVARILPATLFGEKYVDLVSPARPSSAGTGSQSLADGQVIDQDRSRTAVELQTVFERLIPVLRAANPADLSVALSNTADALRGRGAELGRTFVLANRYFAALNRDLPNLQHDIAGLADLASSYADASPDLLRILHNFSVTASTITEKQDTLAQFLSATTGFTATATRVVNDNGDAYIRLAASSVAPLRVLSKYSIVLECLPRGLDVFDRTRLQHAFQGGALHLALIPVNDRGIYTAADKPSLGDYAKVLPPSCQGLPYGNHGLHPRNSGYPFGSLGNDDKGGLLGSTTAGVGSPAEQQQVASLVRATSGRAPVAKGLDDLLLGPMLRGMAATAVGEQP
jgi:phospholipid/cholesterol/gamma-HCH transport system substrate-binding protein